MTRDDASSGEIRHIHFISGDPSPTLRCRILGHSYLPATAYEDTDESDGVGVSVCRRCKALRNDSWGNYSTLRTGEVEA